MARLILSILAGIMVSAILATAVDHVLHVTDIYPPYDQPMFDNGLLFIAFTYRAVFAILGAYITAMIAKDQAKKAVLILGIIGSLMWLAGSIAMWEYAQPWYNIAGIVTSVPLTLIGGKLYEIRARQLN